LTGRAPVSRRGAAPSPADEAAVGLLGLKPPVKVEVEGTLRTDNVMPHGPNEALKTGKIIIPRSQREVDEVIARWRSYGPQPIAHDLECAASPTVPNGTGLHPHLGTIRLAQFGIRHAEGGRPEALVIDCWRYQPGALLDILSDKDWLTIIHFAQMETRWMGYGYGVRIENLIDTRQAAKLIYDRLGFTGEPLPEDLERLGLGPQPLPEGTKLRGPRFALGMVGQRELGVDLDKEQQNSYWDAINLTREQLRYAGEDALVLLDLYERFKPLLTEEDHEELRQSAERLNDKSAGITATEARRRNAELRALVDGMPGAEEALARYGIKPYTPEGKNCESERALRMIAACRNKKELEKMRKALPYMRIHFTNRDKVMKAIEARQSQIRRGTRKPNPVKAKVVGWKQPF